MGFYLPEKRRFRPKELARETDKHVATIFRWMQKGAKGHVLKSYLVGGQRYIDRQDFLTFLDAINAKSGGSSILEPDREADLRHVNEQLKRAGF